MYETLQFMGPTNAWEDGFPALFIRSIRILLGERSVLSVWIYLIKES